MSLLKSIFGQKIEVSEYDQEDATDTCFGITDKQAKWFVCQNFKYPVNEAHCVNRVGNALLINYALPRFADPDIILHMSESGVNQMIMGFQNHRRFVPRNESMTMTWQMDAERFAQYILSNTGCLPKNERRFIEDWLTDIVISGKWIQDGIHYKPAWW